MHKNIKSIVKNVRFAPESPVDSKATSERERALSDSTSPNEAKN